MTQLADFLANVVGAAKPSAPNLKGVAPAGSAPMPPPKDPRVAEMHKQSKRELSPDMDPDTTHLVDRSKLAADIQKYYDLRHELEDNWVNNINPQINTSKDITEAGMKAWAKTIADLVEQRRLMATNIVYQLGNAAQAAQKELVVLNANLINHQEKLKRVLAEVERVERVMGALKWALRVKDLADFLDAFTLQVDGVSKLVVTGTKIVSNKVFDAALDSSGKIQGSFEKLKDYSLSQTIAYEGYSSMGALLTAIQNRIQAVNDKKSLIYHYLQRRERAQKIYDEK